MKVLIVGGGGREHAIALKIKENPEVTALYAAPGNGGIAQIATCLPFKATDVDGIVRWAAENKVDFVIVAPDDPLCLGMVDALAAQGIPVRLDFPRSARERMPRLSRAAKCSRRT